MSSLFFYEKMIDKLRSHSATVSYLAEPGLSGILAVLMLYSNIYLSELLCKNVESVDHCFLPSLSLMSRPD